MFTRESLKTFSLPSKDSLYTALNQGNWNWRRLHLLTALQAARAFKKFGQSRAYVLDDSIKVCHWKRYTDT